MEDDEAAELTLAVERFQDCWPQGMMLVRAEAAEVEPDGRNLEPDIQSIIANENMGIFRILVARKGGRIVGYFSWSVDFDIEAYGTLIANQNAWYVEPGHHGVADKMFDWVINECRRIGVKFIYLHHTEAGRGKTLGRYFVRKGAKLISHNYGMKL